MIKNCVNCNDKIVLRRSNSIYFKWIHETGGIFCTCIKEGKFCNCANAQLQEKP